MTRAGKFDRHVSIEYKTVERDASYGTEVVTWERLELVRAEVQDMLPSRSESVAQGLALARNQTRIRMRYRNDVTSDMRIVVHGDEDVVYQIIGGPAEVGGRKQMIEMVCERYSS